MSEQHQMQLLKQKCFFFLLQFWCKCEEGLIFTRHAFAHTGTKNSHLIIMWWELVEELLDSELLSWAVDIWDLVLRQTRKI